MIQKRVEFANNLRGLAAMLVVFAHYIVHFWCMRIEAAQLTFSTTLNEKQVPTPKIFTFFDFGHSFEFGSIGVGIFFIISGFVIPFSLKKHNLHRFLLGRVNRIFPVYIVGFTITLAMIYITSNIFAIPFDITLNEILIHLTPGIRDVFQSRNIDGIIWTLEIEVKFYIVCAMTILFFRKDSFLLILIPIISTITAIIIGNDKVIGSVPQFLKSAPIYLSYFNIMFIGVTLHLLHENKIKTIHAFIISFLLIAMFHISIASGILNTLKWTTSNYIISFLVFISCMKFDILNKKNKFLSFMANISYPLYVIHGVGGYCLMKILIAHRVGPIQSVLITLLLSIIISTVIHYLIEVKFSKYKGIS